MKINIKRTFGKIGLTSFLIVMLFPIFTLPAFASCDVASGGIGTMIIPPWYKYLDSEDVAGKCRPKFDSTLSTTGTKVGIAVIEILTRVAGFVALGFIIWGGIQYITSQGEPDGLNAAKSTITNAITGLVITIITIGLVQFIGNSIKTTGTASSLPKAAITANMTSVVNLVGSIAILLSIAFVAFGGFKYTVSSGDSASVQKAKNTILYALIGLLVTLSAYTIISLVISRVS